MAKKPTAEDLQNRFLALISKECEHIEQLIEQKLERDVAHDLVAYFKVLNDHLTSQDKRDNLNKAKLSELTDEELQAKLEELAKSKTK